MCTLEGVDKKLITSDTDGRSAAKKSENVYVYISITQYFINCIYFLQTILFAQTEICSPFYIFTYINKLDIKLINLLSLSNHYYKKTSSPFFYSLSLYREWDKGDGFKEKNIWVEGPLCELLTKSLVL